MFYLIWTSMLIIIGLVSFLTIKRLRLDEEFGAFIKFVPWVLLLLVILLTIAKAVYQIPAGHVGIVYRFGAITGQIQEGLRVVAPWNTAVLANTQIQSFRFRRLSSFSQETQDVFVDATLNINTAPQAIEDLYRKVGKNFFQVLVAPRVAQNFKDVSVQYKSVDIAPNRETIRKAVRQRLETELRPYSIEVKDLLLENIDFSPAFKGAIEKKQIATQKALEEEQNVKVQKQKAEQAIETAKGQAQAILINAEKQAKANRMLSASLTPELIQYTLVSKLSDKIEVMILPSGQNFILSPDMLKKKKE